MPTGEVAAYFADVYDAQIGHDWAHEAYAQARARGQLHNRALRGIGARWTRILWRCWQDHTTYDPDLHLNHQPTLTA